MITKNDVIEFFDRCAPAWDAEMIRSDEIIGIILDNAEVTAGKRVLDVACGTGVLIGDYLKRDVSSVTGIDISSEMISCAKAKFKDGRVRFLCGDVEETEFDERFDAVVVYNAFPHFPYPERLIERLASLLSGGGTLTVAHGMSREKIDAHHRGAASGVSMGLPDAETVAAMFAKYFCVTKIIDSDKMYQVVGKKN
ncbi:MAG: class I SAM-dependent methyltransferase [Eubacteriales bacterium]|nr:class I SAM-dependent methyltransferase [Eubacteriales bacterium]